MSSAGFKESSGDSAYFISIASLVGQVYGRTEPTGNTGVLGGSFSTASWAYFGPGKSMSTLTSAGAILKDMGKTVVSSLRTFRKVQLMITGTGGSNSSLSTFGVGGRATGVGEDYLTGYIELGFEGNGTPAPVAQFGR